MSRLEKLKNYYQEQLKEKAIKDISVFIQSIVNVDITKGKYSRFLIESFLNDKFLEEDLIGDLESTVGQAISLFDKHKGKLPINERSVYALNKATKLPLYQSPGDLWNSVKQFQGELSGKELKKEEREQIYRETEFIYKDEETGFQIISPLTEESAQWWGKGTRWCTSAEKNNQFENYVKDAPLLILLMPNDDKLQLWKNSNDIQFMNEADNKVSLDYIEQHWNILEPLCRWLNDLRFIPEKYRTKELCELAIKQDGMALQFVPEEYKTKELCRIAISQNGLALLYLPKKLITKEFRELALKQNGFALDFISEGMRTKEFCELAVSNNGFSLYYVPKELITKELCKLAIQQDGLALSYIPTELITKEICKLAIQQDGSALTYVPYELRTPELCEIAVKNNGYALRCIPEKFKTNELCELAVKQNGDALKYVSEKFKTIEMCELAVQQNGVALCHIPEELGKLSINYKETYQELKEYFSKKDVCLNIN